MESLISTLLESLLQPALALRDQRITRLEKRMSAFDDKLAELDQATTDVANELSDLQAQVAAGDTTAASRLDPIISRLQAMATDPNNVDPNPAPAPAPEPAPSPDVPPAPVTGP